jgi:hypothetical protein
VRHHATAHGRLSEGLIQLSLERLQSANGHSLVSRGKHAIEGGRCQLPFSLEIGNCVVNPLQLWDALCRILCQSDKRKVSMGIIVNSSFAVNHWPVY